MRVFVTEAARGDLRFLRKSLAGHNVWGSPHVLDGSAIEGTVEILSVMVHSQVGRRELEALRSLRMIATRSTGFDHIDLDAASKRGVIVSNVPSYGSNTVAEHTFALILSLSRKVHKAYIRTLHGEFDLAGLAGFDLAGKTLGVVGAGKIGQHVIRIAKGFGMGVLAADPYADAHLAEVLGFELVGLDALLRRSDIVALCCPLTDETHYLMDRDAFSKMMRGSLLINTARGAVVDAEALLWALSDGIVAGAGLDVLEGEEVLPEDALVAEIASRTSPARLETIAENLALMRHPNVIVTPHMAFYSHEALRRILETTAANIRSFAAGSPINVVSS